LVVKDRKKPSTQIGPGLPKMLFGDRADQGVLHGTLIGTATEAAIVAMTRVQCGAKDVENSNSSSICSACWRGGAPWRSRRRTGTWKGLPP
jgi:hypothetical protein